MNCMKPTAPALDGPMFCPNRVSTSAIPARIEGPRAPRSVVRRRLLEQGAQRGARRDGHGRRGAGVAQLPSAALAPASIASQASNVQTTPNAENPVADAAITKWPG